MSLTERGDPADPELSEVRFWAALQTVRPTASYALGAAMIVLFVLETLWGGSESSPTLWRMGANVRERVLAGEVWRLLSSAFLHVGPLHLLLNLWAFWVFGPFLERVLGASRYLVLFTVSALGGSAASVALGEARLSAGASGALWGQMVAGFVLALRPQGLLPPDARDRAVRRGWQPLVVNFIYSFQPRIDMFAHFGGGLVGGALIATGLLTRGLRPPGSDSPASPDREARLPGVAAVLSGTLAVSILAALLAGRPWELRRPPALVRTALPGTEVSIDLPGRMAIERLPEPEPGVAAFSIGDLRKDPLQAWINVASLPAELRGGEARAREQLRKALAAEKLPQGASREGGVEGVDLDGRPAVTAVLRFPNGMRLQTWMMIAGSRLVRVDVALANPDGPAAWRPIPEQLARTLSVVAPPAS